MGSRRNRHPSQVIEQVIRYAEECGWRYQRTGSSSHAWGRLLCPLEAREGCGVSVWSTPRSVEMHARQIRKRVMACQHVQVEVE